MKRIFWWSAGVAAIVVLLGIMSSFATRTTQAGVEPPAGPCGPMDVAFVFDTTGSMGPALANVQAATPSLIADITAASGGDFQLSLVTFKDTVLVENDLAAGNTAAVTANIGALAAIAGGAPPESSDEALNTVINGLDVADRLAGQQTGDFNGVFRAGAVKIIILITDAPPGGFDDTYTIGVDDVNANLRATEAATAGIKISAVFVPTGGDYLGQAAIMENYATTTGGSFITTAPDATGTDEAISDIIEGCGSSGCAESPISPSNVEEILFPGENVQIEKCVEIPDFPPVVDVYFLADTTGSMTPSLAAVQADAASILATIDAGSADTQFGAGSYDDFPGDPPPIFDNQQPITATDADVLTAIGTWAVFNGGDLPESQLFALETIATDPAIGFRADSSRIVVWFGDCPGHDPVPTAATGLSADVTETTATAALVAANIKVVAISTTSSCTDGLDGDPAVGGGAYNLAYGTVEGGAAGQATRIAAATGGVHLSGVAAEDIADAILAGISSVDVEVSMESTCTAPITTTFEPATQTVSGGGTAIFTETISVAANAPGGTYVCRDVVRIDGELLTDPDTAEVAYELKTIKVPEGFLTGGGQILSTTKKKDGLSIGQSGNVGFLADFTLVGNWNVQLHNVGGTALDKGHFKATSFTLLQFHKDAGAGPNPPPANANVGAFAATGTLNGVPGYSIQVCLADRGEPGKSDSIRIRLFDPALTLIYDSSTEFPSEDNTVGGFCANRHKLDTGNYQIHSGVKS